MNNNDLTPIWKALADPTRRHILDLLREKPHTTGELCDVFPDLTRYGVMKHIGVLEEANLILVRRQGKFRYNHLNVVPLQQIHERWLRPYEEQWAQSLIQLGQLAEGKTMSAPAITTHHIEQEIIVSAPLETVFAALLDVNGWWGHRMSRQPDMLRLEPVVGGRFWETRDGSDENGILWGMVTSIEPNDHIQFTGHMGMLGAILGNVVLCTIPEEDGTTRVTLSHQFMGDVPDYYLKGFGDGWANNLDWIKKLAETGERIPPPPQPTN